MMKFNIGTAPRDQNRANCPELSSKIEAFQAILWITGLNALAVLVLLLFPYLIRGFDYLFDAGF
ncbi:MAG: hypothetical protein AXW12_00550 [Thalassospira sp. Nap_22]|nr:MAG: hypothetical protein AXW12_00550 [Thalassospira sp. Nap_22]